MMESPPINVNTSKGKNSRCSFFSQLPDIESNWSQPPFRQSVMGTCRSDQLTRTGRSWLVFFHWKSPLLIKIFLHVCPNLSYLTISQSRQECMFQISTTSISLTKTPSLTYFSRTSHCLRGRMVCWNVLGISSMSFSELETRSDRVVIDLNLTIREISRVIKAYRSVFGAHIEFLIYDILICNVLVFAAVLFSSISLG